MEYDVRKWTLLDTINPHRTHRTPVTRCCRRVFRTIKGWIRTGSSWFERIPFRNSNELEDRRQRHDRHQTRSQHHQPTTEHQQYHQTSQYPPLILLVLFASTVFRIAECCSSRSTPKPRPPSPTLRPNITFQTYDCPEAYAKWYCLNGATCFSVRIGESILYNCECADGYMGQRCEFKDLDGSYLPNRERVLIEKASIAGGVTVAVLFIVISVMVACTYYRRRNKLKRMPTDITQEELDRKPFNTRSSRNPTIIAKHDAESGRLSGYPQSTLSNELGRGRNNNGDL